MMSEAHDPGPRGESERGDDLRVAYRRRARVLWVVALVDVAVWYGSTALESMSLGLAPLARRAFTLLDGILFAALAVGTVLAVVRIRRCPRCGEGFGFRTVRKCPSCGGRVR